MTCPSFQLLYDRIRSNTGLIFVDTYEEPRLVRELKREFKKDDIEFWSATQGLHAIDKEKEADRVKLHHFSPDDCRKTAKDVPTTGNILNALDIIEADCRQKIKNHSHSRIRNIYVIRDPDKFFNNPMPIRKIRDITYLVATAGSTMIMTGAGITVPTDLEKDAAYIQLRIPEFAAIKEGIIKKRILSLIQLNNDQVEQNKEPDTNKLCPDFDVDKISRACGGLTEDEIINTCSFSLTTKKTLDISTILEEKRQIINKNDILTYWVCEEQMSDVGGFTELKTWFDVQKMAMDSEHAPEFRVEQPKAALILGVQGSGKTHIAKALAKSWGKGLIKLDMGKVFAGLVGESEKRMRMALHQAEAAGGVVIIDEMDKGLGGAGSSDRTDGGTTKRVIGTLLTWMSEPHKDLFIIATANDISGLLEAHPELLRKGRFDEIWFSDAPSRNERKEIFEIHLRKRGRDPKKFNLDMLADWQYEQTGSKYDLVGSEIEHSIKEAIAQKFAQNYKGKALKIGGPTDISTEDIMTQLRHIKPISFVGKAPVKRMRDWAKDHARNVSTINCSKETTVAGKNDGPLNLFSVEDDINI